MDKCVNPGLGGLIHAYELKALKAADVERFELHLLECDHCFDELSSFNEEISILLGDIQIKQAVAGQVPAEPSSGALGYKLRRYLWPVRTPVVFRPAFIYSAAALLILAWLGTSPLNKPGKIRSVQSIGFYQTRSGETNVLYKSRSDDAVINFIVRDYNRQAGAAINIFDRNRNLIYGNDRFEEIDGNGLGRLYLSLADMEKGEYVLEIKIPENIPPFDRIVYSFEIK